jgi:hypothetical protein
MLKKCGRKNVKFESQNTDQIKDNPIFEEDLFDWLLGVDVPDTTVIHLFVGHLHQVC